MRKSEYKIKLSSLSDSELFESAKKVVSDSMLGMDYDSWKNELIVEECISRNNNIYSEALDEAIHSVNTFKLVQKGLVVTELFSEMKNAGSSTSQEGVDISVNMLLSSLNIKAQDNIMFCHVTGESMIDENIMSGDILIIDKNSGECDGKIVIVTINSVMFVKRYKVIDNEKWLFSGNKKYQPVKITTGIDFQIIGVVLMKLQNVN